MSAVKDQYIKLLQKADFIFLTSVVTGCPFCMSYLKTFASLSPAITAKGGTPIIVTAENPEHLPQTRETTGYQGEAIVDTENLLAHRLKSEGKLDVAITEKNGYPHGLAQPAVLVMQRDGTVVSSWAIVPSTANLGGAKDRPLLEQVWEDAQGIMDGRLRAPRDTYTKTSLFTGLKQQFFGKKPAAAAAK